MMEMTAKDRLTGDITGGEVDSPPQTCEHDWGEEYHVHLGHEVYGAHSSNKTCRRCGWTLIQNLVREEPPYWASPSSFHFWDILPRPHNCYAGWRGVSILNNRFGEGLPPLRGRSMSYNFRYVAQFDCPCCQHVRTQPYGSVCSECQRHKEHGYFWLAWCCNVAGVVVLCGLE